ncbi:MAG: undecaprenyl/decaprenyl-phosphate alpha-N-acetylglucosaminyl 1-phosphate transferase [Phycisphaerales bacterium]|nr:undecaprenyl/decaprenyl-phosphate alpha-N-acetylglucosaminyl 1-phosphate transferase [Phycisphaerales bacterium]
MGTIALAALVGALVLSAVLTAVVRRVALRIGFVDRPGGHKEHASPVALGGGVAIMLAVFAPLLVGVLLAKWALASGVPTWFPEFVVPHLSGIASKLPVLLAVVGGGLVLHVVGLVDDAKPLGPWSKLAIEIGVGLALAWGFGIRAGEALGAPVSIALTVFWIVLIVNAFNFLDNMDGLSAGVAAIAGAIFAGSAMIAGQIFVPTLAWVLVGALLGFLIFNFSPASVFMGDAGSMVVGYLMAVLTVLTTYWDPGRQTHPVGVLVPLLVLAVPLYDVASVIVHRLKAGESPFRGDRRHFSHRLIRRGMSTRASVLTIYLATAATGLPAMLLPHANWFSAALILGQTVCVVMIIAILEHVPDKRSG